MIKKIITIFNCLITLFLCACTNTTNNQDTTTVIEQGTTLSTSAPTESAPEAEYTTIVIKSTPDDPYSYIIKEIYSLVIDDFENPEFGVSLNDHYYYYLYDIDSNGVDELLIGEKYVIGGIQNIEVLKPEDWGITIFNIYTIRDGVAVEQDIRPWWCAETLLERSILTNGLVRASGRKKDPSYCYFKFVDGKLEYQESLSTVDSKYTHIYIENGVEMKQKVSKSEFNRLRAEIENGAQPIEINWKRIDEYGR